MTINCTKSLSPRHTAFVAYYMIHFNGARAAREAGYARKAAHVQAARLLRNVRIAAEIARRRSALAEHLQDISEDRIKLELARCGFANMADVMVPGENGSSGMNFGLLTKEQTAALAEVVVEEFVDARSGKQVRRTKFKLVDKRRSLELLAKIKGMLTAKHDHKRQHQGLIMQALLEEIDKKTRGKPIVEPNRQ